MLILRFIRIGRKNDPSFRLVVTEKTRPPRSGFSVENLGFYNPVKKTTQLNEERIKYWISKGAKLSDTVNNLLVKNKVIPGEKIDVHAKSKKTEKKEAPAGAPAETEAKPKE